MLEKMKGLAKEKDMCVLATASGNAPYCSLMAYVTDEDCREIYMVTHRTTTKYKNLQKNPSVSLLMDTREEHAGDSRRNAKALTITGIFQAIKEDGKKAFVTAKLLERHPHLREFMNHPDAELLCIKVKSFLLLDGLTKAHFEMI
jgi:nitroimidazol reductase NimA-like FMN-containing flavoprotein (pyridoxamine 5'-phosphate oxidase superfamily)